MVVALLIFIIILQLFGNGNNPVASLGTTIAMQIVHSFHSSSSRTFAPIYMFRYGLVWFAIRENLLVNNQTLKSPSHFPAVQSFIVLFCFVLCSESK